MRITCSEQELREALRDISLEEEVAGALALAKYIHKNHKRSSGAPYLENHVYAVTLNGLHYMKHHKLNEVPAERVVNGLLLHDSEEMSESTVLPAIVHACGQDVANDVRAYTKPNWKTFYGETEEEQRFARDTVYYAILLEQPKHVRVGKLLDRIHNLHTLDGFTTSEQARKQRTLEGSHIFHVTLAANTSAFLYRELTRVLQQQMIE